MNIHLFSFLSLYSEVTTVFYKYSLGESQLFSDRYVSTSIMRILEKQLHSLNSFAQWGQEKLSWRFAYNINRTFKCLLIKCFLLHSTLYPICLTKVYFPLMK